MRQGALGNDFLLQTCGPIATGDGDSDRAMLTALFAVVSLLYATVGQAGGTAFLALVAFASFPSNEMRPTALLLNIVLHGTVLF